MKDNIKILTIIPTLNAADDLPELLRMLTAQSFMSDILIVDSSSADDTVDIAKSFGCDVIEIDRKEFNHAATRNIAIKYKANFYLFMTQDAVPVDDMLIANFLFVFDDKDVVAAYARQLPLKNADLIERFARETNYPATSMVKSKESLQEIGIKTFFCSNSCAIYRGDYFRQVGGFTKGLIMNEDMEYVARAILDDKKIAYMSDAKVWHSHVYGVRDVFKRYFDIGIFFKTNQWVLEEVNKYSSTESTGIAQAKKELAYLVKNSPFSLPKSIIFSLTKFTSFKLGFYHDKLPKILVRYFSLHKNFHS